MAELKPANQNPWYVLMTLYGEQGAKRVDRKLHRKNRAAWNAWSCQALSESDRALAAEQAGVSVAEVSAWDARSAEIENLYNRARKERNGDSVPQARLPSVHEEISFRSTIFANSVVLTGAVFAGRTSFYRASFEAKADFRNAIFLAASYYGRTVFRDGAYFGGATFSARASFSRATFYGRATFDSATFQSNAYFRRTTFLSKVAFDSVPFGGLSYFSGAAFENSDTPSASFDGSHFMKPASFRVAWFRYGYPSFASATFDPQMTFSAEAELWPEEAQPKYDRPEAALLELHGPKASCAKIRHNLSQQGLPEEAHFFFRREMGFAGQIGSWWQRLPYRAFGALSEYGYSIQKPALWLLAAFVVPAILYLFPIARHQIANAEPNYPLTAIAEAFGISFASLFNFFGFQKTFLSAAFEDLNGWLKILSAAQTVSGYVLLFFLGLGLRSRFRLR